MQHPHPLPLIYLTTVLFAGPPSAPVNLVYRLKQSTLVLEWSPPVDLGGRSDISYNLLCLHCSPSSPCTPCGHGVSFVPQQRGLVGRTATLMNLLPQANYTIRVEAVNGVSGLGSSSEQPYAEMTIFTGVTGRKAGGVFCGGRYSPCLMCLPFSLLLMTYFMIYLFNAFIYFL